MLRRNFLKTSGIFTASLLGLKAIAGPFKVGELSYRIPEDKKIDTEWIKSLYQRGFATKYFKSKKELQYIGMPVGGINTGTVYLGGDGRLWLWDIFNANQEGIEPMEKPPGDSNFSTLISRNGSAYVKPAQDIRPVNQGFAFKITWGGKTIIKKMEAADWDDIAFEATYPMAKIRYMDKALPVEISAEVHSPFIALDEKNSGLPATIYTFTVKNKSTQPVTVTILGWLENKVCLRTAKEGDNRVNKVVSSDNLIAVEASLNNATDAERTKAADYGTMSIAVLDAKGKAQTDFLGPNTEGMFQKSNNSETSKSIKDKLLASVSTSLEIKPKTTAKADFVIAWHFSNLSFKQIKDKGRFYNTLFKSAFEVAAYIGQNFKTLSAHSRLWRDTWYDSTLPHWFLERTFLNISCLSTTTAHRMESGRFYAWEGVGCCPGTCTHVWQYAQAMGRIFPALEKDTRQRIDLGIAYQPDGSMWYRAEADKRPAVDGQAGTILRFYREHQMSIDDGFLKNNWNKIKQTIIYLMTLDKNKDGMEDTPVENTLDAMWDGEIAWIVGLCIAAVKAGEKMAEEMNDADFAAKCTDYVEKGSKNMSEKLFNGEYFIHRPDDEKGRQRLGSYNTCHIDQLYGQSWAYQVGLGRILDKNKTQTALRSLWKYNFTPDVGPYIKEHQGGRPYALAGDGGMIMNTNPKNEAKPYGDNVTWQLGYFHECMSGFEHQVAAHLMAEGMTDEALILTRMIHDRYHAAQRNPFNEIECSDHYARAMASYGTFITACGFEYHGPKGYMRFAPKMKAENFKTPFTAAEGWGTFQQQKTDNQLKASVQLQYGTLKLSTFGVETTHKVLKINVLLNGKKVNASFVQNGNDCLIQFKEPVTISAQQKLTITI
jgi:non-lysosomal glucosylceramidase